MDINRPIIDIDIVTEVISTMTGIPLSKISAKESKRNLMILEYGYKVLHINELEYKKNKLEIIDKCIKFLRNEK